MKILTLIILACSLLSLTTAGAESVKISGTVLSSEAACTESKTSTGSILEVLQATAAPRILFADPMFAELGISHRPAQARIPWSSRSVFNAEAQVESEGQSPSYWRVLGPIVLTVGVGTATWLLFSTRSR